MHDRAVLSPTPAHFTFFEFSCGELYFEVGQGLPGAVSRGSGRSSKDPVFAVRPGTVTGQPAAFPLPEVSAIGMEWQGALSLRGIAPPARRGQSMSKFPLRNIIVVFGGQTRDNGFLNDMHILNMDNNAWSSVSYDKSSRVPPPRAFHTLTIISPRTLVLFGGDSGDANNPTALNDLWSFDFNTKVWRLLHGCVPASSPSFSSDTPSARFNHTAVFHANNEQNKTLFPAIYVYGGNCTSGGEAVYCLRIRDWAWIALTLAEPRDPAVRKLLQPVTREQHAAAWIPGEGGGMLIVGGDGGGGYLSDIWLFQPPSAEANAWQWRQIKIAMARSVRGSRLTGCAGHSLVQFESRPRTVLVWGGLRDAAASEAADAVSAVLVDLDNRTSEGLLPSGNNELTPRRRIQHSLVQFTTTNDRRACVILYGGVSISGLGNNGETVDPSLFAACQWARLELRTPPHASANGAVSSPTRVRIPDPSRARARSQRPAAVQGSIVGTVTSGALPPSGPASRPLSAPDGVDTSMYAPPIARGTPVTGRIIDTTEVGFFVSVIIQDRECKGVLVVNNSTVRPAPSGSPIALAAPPQHHAGEAPFTAPVSVAAPAAPGPAADVVMCVESTAPATPVAVNVAHPAPMTLPATGEGASGPSVAASGANGVVRDAGLNGGESGRPGKRPRVGPGPEARLSPDRHPSANAHPTMPPARVVAVTTPGSSAAPGGSEVYEGIVATNDVPTQPNPNNSVAPSSRLLGSSANGHVIGELRPPGNPGVVRASSGSVSPNALSQLLGPANASAQQLVSPNTAKASAQQLESPDTAKASAQQLQPPDTLVKQQEELSQPNMTGKGAPNETIELSD